MCRVLSIAQRPEIQVCEYGLPLDLKVLRSIVADVSKESLITVLRWSIVLLTGYRMVSLPAERFSNWLDGSVLAVLLAALLSAVSTCHAQDTDWRLVWSDEFGGESLDYSKWEIEVNAFGGGNNELQLYTDLPKNVRVEGGNLVLEAHRERADILGTVRDYSSGKIRSKRRGDWTYGKFEMRAKLPSGQGVWPAFWMMPTDNVYGTWASSGEIDIMEFKGQEPGVIWGTLHHGSPWPNNKHTGTQYRPVDVDYTKDFHTYAIEWEKGKMTWLVDGHAYQTQTEWSSSGGPYPAPFDQKFHLILNLAIGGGFVGNVDASTPFPRQYLVDYVRVYQKDVTR